MKISDRQFLYLMAALSGAALFCYTSVLRLCQREAQGAAPERRARIRKVANLAHVLDWLINVMLATVGFERLFREEQFGGQHQPRWLKIYFIVSGPLPTIGMVGAMITGHRWGDQLASDARKRRIHRWLSWFGYVSWWFCYLPIFGQPLLNRLAARRVAQTAANTNNG
jgi:hypothetical protein